MADRACIAIEVKLADAVSSSNVRHLRWLQDQIGDRLVDRVVIHTGSTALSADPGRTASPPELSYNTRPILYDSDMATMDVSTARAQFADLLCNDEPTVIARYGEPVGAVVSYAFLQRAIEAMEDLDDVAAFDAAIAEGGENIPWDQVKADLGWT